jgi:tetratricopeptide (TPR) repeat protein
MSDNYINIDNYFQKKLSEDEKVEFEKILSTDASFAEEVAFYAHTKAIERENILQQRHTEWSNLPQKKGSMVSFSKIVVGIAAMLVLVLSWLFLFQSKQTPEQMADIYIKQNFDKLLSVKMSGGADSLEIGKQLASEMKYDDAEKIFISLIKKDSTNFNAKKMAGIVCVKAGNYDKAVNYFHLLGNQAGLYQNPGYFYEALALLQTNLPNNKNRAKKLLETVISQNLEGKSEAEKIVDNWK